jgi:holliday junction DNA helicase RuvB
LSTKLPLQALNERDAPAAPVTPGTENILRPKTLREYIGQKAVAGKLEVFMAAAKARGSVLDHVLLSGPPGLGKTTLAYIMAQEMGGRLHLAPGPTLEKSVDLLALLSNLKKGDVLFIDEIHRLSPVVEEALYPAMEDFQIQVILGEGASAQSVTLPVERFTLVGATTQAGKLTGPLRDRFGIHLNFDFYNNDEISQILRRSASLLKMDLTEEEIVTVATRSRGTPRIGNRLLARVRDFLEVLQMEKGTLSEKAKGMLQTSRGRAAVEKALEFLEVDHRGFQLLDRRYLKVLMEQFKGGPAGIEALAASLSEDRSTLEETVEPFLLKEGFIVRTSRGRLLTDLSYQHFGMPCPSRSADDPLLF